MKVNNAAATMNMAAAAATNAAMPANVAVAMICGGAECGGGDD